MPLRQPSPAFFSLALTTRGAVIRRTLILPRNQCRQKSGGEGQSLQSRYLGAGLLQRSGPIKISSGNEPPKKLSDIYSQDKGIIPPLAKSSNEAGIIRSEIQATDTGEDGPLARLRKKGLGLIRYDGRKNFQAPGIVRPDSIDARLARYPRRHQKAIKKSIRKRELREKNARKQEYALNHSVRERNWLQNEPAESKSRDEAFKSESQASKGPEILSHSQYTMTTGITQSPDQSHENPWRKVKTSDPNQERPSVRAQSDGPPKISFVADPDITVDGDATAASNPKADENDLLEDEIHDTSQKEKQKHLLTSILDIYSQQESNKPSPASPASPDISSFEAPISTTSVDSVQGQYLPGTEQNPSSKSPVSGGASTTTTTSSLPPTYRSLFDKHFGNRPKSMSTMASQRQATATSQLD